MEVIIFDIKTAFLHGDLEEQIFMEQPEGFKDKLSHVCLLKKSLYCLKQAPKNWDAKFTSFLKMVNFEPANDNPCIYYDNERNNIIVLHVDNGLMIGRNKATMMKILKELHKEFNITFDSGEDGSFTYSAWK
ncbi:hypothetical protein TKK_0014779 [Trichogramma kaykai]|uniref:Reverse transcriptase Ty1/copia-type domain-containing protein n=1 Tax=Trichogramma kaykai TaxID=54128 RepID=A0ABD2WCG1_9HYME